MTDEQEDTAPPETEEEEIETNNNIEKTKIGIKKVFSWSFQVIVLVSLCFAVLGVIYTGIQFLIQTLHGNFVDAFILAFLFSVMFIYLALWGYTLEKYKDAH